MIDIIVGVSNEEVTVSGENIVLLAMEVFEFDCCMLATSFGASLGVFSVDVGVAIGPHLEEFFPDGCDGVGCPEKPRL